MIFNNTVLYNEYEGFIPSQECLDYCVEATHSFINNNYIYTFKPFMYLIILNIIIILLSYYMDKTQHPQRSLLLELTIIFNILYILAFIKLHI